MEYIVAVFTRKSDKKKKTIIVRDTSFEMAVLRMMSNVRERKTLKWKLVGMEWAHSIPELRAKVDQLYWKIRKKEGKEVRK